MSLLRVKTPPEDGSSYIIDRWDGETFTLPGSKGAFHMWASQKQTGNTFSVFGWDGPASDQGFHRHKITHDVFLLTEGRIKVYCGDDCKILEPGDFASVPPGLLHKPTPLGPITRVVPLISPGDWVDFFRGFKDDFDGVMFPEFDDRDPLADGLSRLPPGFQEKTDTYLEVVENPVEPSEWTEENHILPDEVKGYYLQHDKGPRWLLGSIVSRPFITTKQSNGRFAISSITSSDSLGQSVFEETRLSFPQANHLFLLLDGLLEITIGKAKPTIAHAGEVIFLAAGTPFSLRCTSRYVRFYSYVNGNGIESIIHEAGNRVEGVALPDKPAPVDPGRFREAIQKLGSM
ncbi:hypothetical protein G7054_g13140 [Neopestalotiopsis clavispora]|nr:hypothetical protein G7054_g13140 [Neopestalotiopsis clavispora]